MISIKKNQFKDNNLITWELKQYFMYTQLDDKFRDIHGLKWLPWVGDKYFEIPSENRMLIIGESYYGGGTNLAEKEIFFKNVLKTREFIEEMAIEGTNWGTRLFPNLHTTLFPNHDINKNEEKRERFWQLSSFYNFVQKPMLTISNRPTPEEFRSGWDTFFAVYKLLKPQICLFIGTTSADKFDEKICQATDLKADKMEWYCEKINGAYPKFTKLFLANEPTSLYFIKHTSMRFSSKKWNEYLKDRIGNQLLWLEKEII